MKLKTTQLLMSDDGKIVMGTGRMKILESIERTGSINKTAKELKMGYKTVWSKIKSTEAHYGQSVVSATRQSGSCLTPAGKVLLENFRQLKKRCIAADDQIFKTIFNSKS